MAKNKTSIKTPKKTLNFKTINLILSAALYVIISCYIFYTLNVSNFTPVAYQIPEPPKLEGILTPNSKLRNAQLLLKGNIWGPESILVEDDVMYTGTMDGRVVQIINNKIVKEIKFRNYTDCGKFLTEPLCGRPLGIRRLNKDNLIVADAYLGIFSVNFKKETSEHILSSNNTRLHNKTLKFVNDLDVLNEEEIFFTDSSSKWDRRHFLNSFLEQKGDGRLFFFNIVTNELNVVLKNLYFANGVQIHPDRQSVLVSECSMSRIVRYYFDGVKKGKTELFVENLPGFPDNIRLSKDKKHFYVALAGFRSKDSMSLIDRLGNYVFIRKIIVDLIPEQFLTNLYKFFKPKYGIFVKIDVETSKIVDAPQDVGGIVIDDISQVSDDDKFYYLGSFHADFIAKVNKKSW